MRNPVLTPMAAAFKNYWLYIHVYFAWLAIRRVHPGHGGGGPLRLKRRTRNGGAEPLLRRFPSLDVSTS